MFSKRTIHVTKQSSTFDRFCTCNIDFFIFFVAIFILSLVYLRFQNLLFKYLSSSKYDKKYSRSVTYSIQVKRTVNMDLTI